MLYEFFHKFECNEINFLLIAGFLTDGRKKSSTSSKSSSAQISTGRIEQIIEKLKCTESRHSTAINYLGIWRQFNNFLVRLDRKLKFWEDRVLLYATALVEDGIQSSTLKSHMGKGIHWIMSEFSKLISSQKEYLPNKAKQPMFPTLSGFKPPITRVSRIMSYK